MKAANAMFSYLENLEQILAPNQVFSDPLFLRVNRREIGLYRQSIEIDHKQFQIIDPSSYGLWHHGHPEASVILLVVPLTDYCKFSDGNTERVRRTLAVVEKGSMTDFECIE